MVSQKSRPASKDRQARAYEQSAEYVIVPASPERNDWQVIHTSGRSYLVDLDANTCTCPDHQARRVECKHLVMARWEAASAPPAGSSPTPAPVTPITAPRPQMSDERYAAACRDRELLWD